MQSHRVEDIASYQAILDQGNQGDETAALMIAEAARASEHARLFEAFSQSRAQTIVVVRAFHREMHHLGDWKTCHSWVCVAARYDPLWEGIMPPDEEVEAVIEKYGLEKQDGRIWARPMQET